MIYFASDHGGFEMKTRIKEHVSHMAENKMEDCGNSVMDKDDDFVDFAKLACEKINEGDFGILLCRNGVGVSIVANRFANIRAVLGFDEVQVAKAREDDDCNVLCLPADYLDGEKAVKIVESFLNTPFSGEERFVRRLEKIKSINQ